jgi:hypothetical protein
LDFRGSRAAIQGALQARGQHHQRPREEAGLGASWSSAPAPDTGSDRSLELISGLEPDIVIWRAVVQLVDLMVKRISSHTSCEEKLVHGLLRDRLPDGATSFIWFGTSQLLPECVDCSGHCCRAPLARVELSPMHGAVAV